MGTNWLQVLASAKLPEIDERERKEFESQMTNLYGLKAQQQALEFVLPGEGAFNGEAQFVAYLIDEALAPAFGLLAVARVLFDVGRQSGIEDTLAIGFVVKARIQIEYGPGHVKPD